jgi:hypothetical protein
MALPDLTTVDALEVRLKVPTGSLSGADLDYAGACIADASALVRAASERDWVDDAGALDVPASLVTVALQAALRGYRNPDGVAGENFGVYSYNLPQGETSVALTKSEVATCEKVAATFAAQQRGGNFVGSMTIRSAYSSPEPETGGGLVYTL